MHHTGPGPRGAITKLKLVLTTAIVGMVASLLGAAAAARADPFAYVTNPATAASPSTTSARAGCWRHCPRPRWPPNERADRGGGEPGRKSVYVTNDVERQRLPVRRRRRAERSRPRPRPRCASGDRPVRGGGEPGRAERLRRQRLTATASPSTTSARAGRSRPRARPRWPPATSPFGVAVSPDGGSVYVTNFGGDSVSQYDVGAGRGALVPRTRPRCRRRLVPTGVAVSPDGGSVYVANQLNVDSVSQYDVGAGGALHRRRARPRWPPAADPSGVAVSPDGRSAYVTRLERRRASPSTTSAPAGRSQPKSPATVAAGDTPSGVAVSPDGGSVYVASELGDTCLPVQRRRGRGALAQEPGHGGRRWRPAGDRGEPGGAGTRQQGPVQERRLAQLPAVQEPGAVHRVRQPRPVDEAAGLRGLVQNYRFGRKAAVPLCMESGSPRGILRGRCRRRTWSSCAGRSKLLSAGTRRAWMALCDAELEIEPVGDWPESPSIRGPEAAWEFFRHRGRAVGQPPI